MSTCTTLPPLPKASEQPVMSVPEAGAYLGMNRVQAYRAAKSGHLPTIWVSERRIKVPTAGLRQMLGLSPE